MIIEVCVDSVASARQAKLGGADRLELCQDLAVGGTTPSKGLVVTTQKQVDLPIIAMIRPRGGDFCYDEDEFQTMLEDIRLMKDLGIAGIVTGILTPEAEVDLPRMEQIMALASGMEVVFHRAFDLTKDLFTSFDRFEKLGVCRVLTAGGSNRAEDGKETIRQLLTLSSSVTVMPGSGINQENASLFKQMGATEIHLSGKVPRQSSMIYRKEGIYMGAAGTSSEYLREETSAEKINNVLLSIV